MDMLNISRVAKTALVVIGLAMHSGCHVIDRIHAHHADEEPVAALTADVGGEVQLPGLQVLTVDGVSLERVLARSGGLTELVRSRGLDQTFVSIQRGVGAQAVTTYFLASEVEGGPSRHVIVMPDDYVHVGPISSTSIGNRVAGETPQVLLRGVIPASATGLRTVATDFQGVVAQNVKDVISDTGLPQKADTMVISRRSISGLGVDRFIIPVSATSGAVPASSTTVVPDPEPSPLAPNLSVDAHELAKRRFSLIYGDPTFPGDIPPLDRLFTPRPGDPRFGEQQLTIGAAIEILTRQIEAENEADAPPGVEAVPQTVAPAAGQTAVAGFGQYFPLNGDDIFFTHSELAPMVLEGLVRPMVRARVAEQLSHHAQVQQAVSESAGPVTRTAGLLSERFHEAMQSIPFLTP